jgi:hypothetical protein
MLRRGLEQHGTYGSNVKKALPSGQVWRDRVCTHVVDEAGVCRIVADAQLDTVRPGEVLFQVPTQETRGMWGEKVKETV